MREASTCVCSTVHMTVRPPSRKSLRTDDAQCVDGDKNVIRTFGSSFMTRSILIFVVEYDWSKT